MGTLMWVLKKKSLCTLRWWGTSSGEEDEAEQDPLLGVRAQPPQLVPTRTPKRVRPSMKR